MKNDMRVRLTLNVQIASLGSDIPHRSTLRRWIMAALHHKKIIKKPYSAEITLRIIDEAESAALNKTYRHKQGPTNILSFPLEPNGHLKVSALGDMAICAPLVAKEAKIRGKVLLAHWAHLIIHGTLHLLGYDHIKQEDAQVMEALEKEILLQLGYSDPYGEDDSDECR